MMYVKKRDGTQVPFDGNKIEEAIKKAFLEVDNVIYDEFIARDIANTIKDIVKSVKIITIEEIQDMVEENLMAINRPDVAKAYILYRERRKMLRENNKTYDSIMKLIEFNNEELKEENSNKKSTIGSTQRDYMAGEVSKDLTMRYFLPKDIADAHKNGLIHFHDADYFAQRIHNCLDKETRFITSQGVKSFQDFQDGDTVTVLTKDGNWRKAIVHRYGEQDLYEYTFYYHNKNYTQKVLATENHRWYLASGNITTTLNVGQQLAKPTWFYNQDEDYSTFSDEEKLMWCKGFALGDGTVEFKGAGKHLNSTRIRLCGKKDNQWLERFNIPGCKIRDYKYDNGDREAVVYNYHKEIPEFQTTKEIKAFMNGLYCADGRMALSRGSRNYSIQSSKPEVIDFIRQYAPVAGLYLTRENDLTGKITNFTSDKGRKYTILFSFIPKFTRHYTVLNKTFAKRDEVWCLEVEEEQNFVLANGIVTGNCDVWNLDDMLQNGTMISNTLIEKPHSFSTACNITTQIMAQVASSQYGGQTITLTHLAPFVDISRQKILKETWKEYYLMTGLDCCDITDVDEEIVNELAEQKLKKEIEKGIQTIQYQILTLQTTNGQTPFCSIFMYLGEAKDSQEKNDLAMIIEEVLKQRIKGVKNEKGVYVTPTFPKLLYVLEEDNIHPDSSYWYLTELAAECTAKRMVPDYISEKIMKRDKLSKGEKLGAGDCYPCMGCRSFLTPDRSGNGWDNISKSLNYNPYEPKYYGRFNQGVVTINLVDVALTSKRDQERFWEILDERLNLCHRALQIRHKRLEGTPSDIAPILWQHGALARLEKGETIDKLLHGGYSTISLGYAGLWECVKYMTDKKLTEEEGKQFGLKVMEALNEATNAWKANEDIDYSIYGTPLESTTYKFAKCLKNRFGVIEGVTDKDYITNSYHVHVTEDIDAFSKLSLESDFQKLSPGGAISYVEVPNMQNNIPAVLTILQFIYDNIMYAELNTKSDYCLNCDYTGEIKPFKGKDGKWGWKCPNCGNTNQEKMSVIRRTCGYLGGHYWNQGRTEEISERVLHL